MFWKDFEVFEEDFECFDGLRLYQYVLKYSRESESENEQEYDEQF